MKIIHSIVNNVRRFRYSLKCSAGINLQSPVWSRHVGVPLWYTCPARQRFPYSVSAGRETRTACSCSISCCACASYVSMSFVPCYVINLVPRLSLHCHFLSLGGRPCLRLITLPPKLWVEKKICWVGKPKCRRLSFTEKFSSQIEHKIVKIIDVSKHMENVTYRIETSSVDQSLESCIRR